MPVYEYFCPTNGRSVTVVHKMTEKLTTWGELCAAANIDLDDTPADAPVERLLFAPGICTPVGDSKLKELGFTKLVRRDQGVYENVTRTDKEARYMVAGDKSTLPDLKSRITD
jgi:predicted nucleic acid-binding Zn ribbon protein